MSEADFNKWQRRYTTASPAGEPEAFLAEVLPGLSGTGRALDIAGGRGRNALAISAHGYDTTLLDVSPLGLEAARSEAQRRGLSLTTKAQDLDEGLPLDAHFELVTVTWFLLTPAHWAQLPHILSPGADLIYVQPTLQNQQRHAHPSARFLVQPGDLAHHAHTAGLEVMRHELGWDAADHHTERLWARRAP